MSGISVRTRSRSHPMTRTRSLSARMSFTFLPLEASRGEECPTRFVLQETEIFDERRRMRGPGGREVPAVRRLHRRLVHAQRVGPAEQVTIVPWPAAAVADAEDCQILAASCQFSHRPEDGGLRDPDHQDIDGVIRPECSYILEPMELDQRADQRPDFRYRIEVMRHD